MGNQEAFAPGKIILTGEHAVVMGEPGIAMPSHIGVRATFIPNKEREDIEIVTAKDSTHPLWKKYTNHITSSIRKNHNVPGGTLEIKNELPEGKGMGSSTALIIVITRALVGDDEKTAKKIEDELSPGNSGIDFAVIWRNEPLKIEKGNVSPIMLSEGILGNSLLIDTGTPNETTAELVAWIQGRKDQLKDAIKAIGDCTRALEQEESLMTIFPRHVRAQINLGVVPPETQKLISSIESIGGAAKVLGAGAKTGGGGMVLAIHPKMEVLKPLVENEYPVFQP